MLIVLQQSKVCVQVKPTVLATAWVNQKQETREIPCEEAIVAY